MSFPIVILISGRGSNMLRLLEYQGNYEVRAVISNKVEAGGIALATQRGVPTRVVSRADFPSGAAQKREIFEQVKELDPRLIVLAGYMQIVEPYFVEEFEGRIVNIHPSLLPDFPGLDTHARVLAAKRPEHGCTVHLVDTGVDTGSIIAQAAVSVLDGDTPDTLAKRVQTEELRLFPWVVDQIATSQIVLSAAEVRYTHAARVDAAQRNFRIPS